MAYTPRMFTKQVWNESTDTFQTSNVVAGTRAQEIQLRWDGYKPADGLAVPLTPTFSARQEQALEGSFAPKAIKDVVDTGRLSEGGLSATFAAATIDGGTP